MQVNIYEAKARLSKLIEAAEKGEEVIIARAGQPLVRLVPITNRGTRRFGIDSGQYSVPDDFDAPLPPETLSAFEG